MQRINIEVAELGTIRATFAHDWRYGVTTYRLRAPRVAGTFVLAPDVVVSASIDPDSEHLRVEFGQRPSAGDGYWQMHTRQDRPVVNGVDLVGSAGVNTARIRSERLTGRRLSVQRHLGPYRSERAPEATTERTAAVIDGLVFHWLGRPENYALRLHAAQAAVAQVRAEKHHAIRAATERVAEARSDLTELAAQLEAAEAFDALAHVKADVV